MRGPLMLSLGAAALGAVALVPVKRAVRANRRRLSRAKRVDAVVSHLRRLVKG